MVRLHRLAQSNVARGGNGGGEQGAMIEGWTPSGARGWLAKPSWFEPGRAWMRAALSGEVADPFSCTPFWQLPLHESRHPGWPLLVREDSDSAIAFAIQALPSDGGVRLLPIDSIWAFGCPLLGPRALDLMEDTLAALKAQCDGPQVRRLEISGIATHSALARALEQRCPKRWRLEPAHFLALCTASLAGGLDGYFSRRSANFRKKLRQQARRAGQAGVSYERVAPAGPAEAGAAYERMLEVERRSWKGRRRDGLLGVFSLTFYQRLLARLCLAGAGRVIFARSGDRDIGFIFGGVVGGIYRGQQFSFDVGWEPFSIGNLLQMEQIGWLCEDGARRYDMGPSRGHAMAYKAHWTEEETWQRTLTLEQGI